jgi:hypothetical protein
MDTNTWIQLFAQITAIAALCISLIVTRWNLSAAAETTKAELKSQKEIKLTEIKAELLAKARQTWISDFRSMTTEFLIICDPDNLVESVTEKTTRELEITKSTLRLELYLDPRDPDHSKFKNSIIDLSLACTPKYARPGGKTRLELSSEVVEKAKIVIKKEMKWLEEQFKSND